MESKNSIQYKYALNSENKTVCIEDLERTPDLRNQVFTCISCDNILIPKLGKVRQKHFAHKYTYNCSEETYLHKLAKNLFFQEYQKCLNRRIPFYLGSKVSRVCNANEAFFGITCQLESFSRFVDLTKIYTNVLLETREGEFIPDILLTNDSGNEKLFIEIAVTHFLTEKKANSSFNIVEIQIKSESDIDFIYQHLIRQNDPRVKRINFPEKIEIKNHCNHQNCPNKISVFIVFKSQRSIIIRESLNDIYFQLQSQNDSIVYYEILEPLKSYYKSSDQYKQRVINAHNIGIKIKNCFLCRYHGENFFSNKPPIFCKFLKIKCISNHASECNYYKPDPKCFPKIPEIL